LGLFPPGAQHGLGGGGTVRFLPPQPGQGQSGRGPDLAAGILGRPALQHGLDPVAGEPGQGHGGRGPDRGRFVEVEEPQGEALQGALQGGQGGRVADMPQGRAGGSLQLLFLFAGGAPAAAQHGAQGLDRATVAGLPQAVHQVRPGLQGCLRHQVQQLVHGPV